MPKSVGRHKNLDAIILRSENTGSEMKPIATLLRAGLLALVATTASASERGAVTNLPLPRFVSLKASEGNVRRGPSLTHRIDWVFKRRDMPL